MPVAVYRVLDPFHSSSVSLPFVFPLLMQTSGFALALGNLVHGLSVCGHGKAEDLGHRLLPAWIRIVLTEVGGHVLHVILYFYKGRKSYFIRPLIGAAEVHSPTVKE